MTGIEIMTMVQAHRMHPALGPGFWVMMSIHLVGVLGYTGYMLAVRYRAPRDR